MSGNLERELATYSAKLPELLINSGRYALIHADDVVGIFDTYADALKAGYERFRLEPFLVKQINAVEQILQFSRELSFAPDPSSAH
jgi:hypothetical protein